MLMENIIFLIKTLTKSLVAEAVTLGLPTEGYSAGQSQTKGIELGGSVFIPGPEVPKKCFVHKSEMTHF